MFQGYGLALGSGSEGRGPGAAGKLLRALGCRVEDSEPDFSDATECFVGWRHWSVEAQVRGYAGSPIPPCLNEYVHWHVEEGRKLTGPYLARLDGKRTALYERMRAFMEKYEFFILPVNQVLPFDVKTHYPTEIAGVKMENYIAWMKSAYYVSTVGNPAISVPCAPLRQRTSDWNADCWPPQRRLGCLADGLCLRARDKCRKTPSQCPLTSF